MIQEERLRLLRAGMTEAGCDAFFSFSPPANQYLTGFRGTASAIIATRDTALFLCDFRYTEQAQAQVHAWAIEEVEGNREQVAAERLRDLHVQRACFDPNVLSAAWRDTMAAVFPGELKAVPDLVSGMRQVKSSDEIAAIRAASELAEDAVEAVIPTLEEGITEREVAARIEYAFKARGAQRPSFDTIVLFGARSSLPHGMPGGRRLQPGDIVLVDCGCEHNGYCSDLTRTWVFGRIPGAWFAEIYQTVYTAQQAALGVLCDGAGAAEADAAARDIIAAAGHAEHFGHGLGHGVGIEVHEAPRMNRNARAVLRAGMTVTCEPGIYLPGKGGVRIEDLVVITDSECAVLTRLPKELKVLEA
jgi:Xaa-Pro aminopeptidase